LWTFFALYWASSVKKCISNSYVQPLYHFFFLFST
jgi:hypothetical protein